MKPQNQNKSVNICFPLGSLVTLTSFISRDHWTIQPCHKDKINSLSARRLKEKLKELQLVEIAVKQ